MDGDKDHMTTAFAQYPSLSDKTVFVTGGASGIGAGIVSAFAQQGARVGFVDLDIAASQALVREHGSHIVFAACDLRDVQALKVAFATLQSALGPATVLINNAARAIATTGKR
jgi:D-xylose 1-dehydrogenase